MTSAGSGTGLFRVVYTALPNIPKNRKPHSDA
jgi:hypothetical protein